MRPDHAQYLAHWLKPLKDDSKAIFTAAARAAEAVNYLNALQRPEPGADPTAMAAGRTGPTAAMPVLSAALP